MTIGHEHIDKHMISAMDDGKQQSDSVLESLARRMVLALRARKRTSIRAEPPRIPEVFLEDSTQ